jgi:alpha-amylase
MTAILFYFQVHQPWRLRRYSHADVGSAHDYFDDGLNEFVLRRVAERCYLPMNRLLREAIRRTDGRFRCSYSVSGTALAQFERWTPAVIDSFADLVDSGAVELIAETAYHSHAAYGDRSEFERQVEAQRATLRRLFGVAPTTFRNTELVLDEGIAQAVEQLGFRTLLGEGADQLLAGRSPRAAYRPAGTAELTLLLRSYSLSDDIAFRFSNRTWSKYPLFAPTFVQWLERDAAGAPFVGLFMDYETFGEHQSVDTGIFDFMAALPELVLARPGLSFATPSEVTAAAGPRTELAYPRPISWADAERDLSAWFGNPLQRAAHRAVYDLLPRVRAAAQAGRPELYETWRRMTTSDHTYYMSTKFAQSSDGDVHEYFSPYDSPHQAFATYMYALEDLERQLGLSTG